eukprot:CAMPEP_0115003264 /NCGR_PEP_ID=MMETSP0216-20121206/18505_1 /TAXON_ID=223996 /ORGANISM="Protocruzia adherens, Strain Boccale" /LENGTH=420 /DNA_ID=CAMNT_0002369031 /DNA_START=142 /DNA_END=1404 /DNA_ORIENTATION=+
MVTGEQSCSSNNECNQDFPACANGVCSICTSVSDSNSLCELHNEDLPLCSTEGKCYTTSSVIASKALLNKSPTLDTPTLITEIATILDTTFTAATTQTDSTTLTLQNLYNSISNHLTSETLSHTVPSMQSLAPTLKRLTALKSHHTPDTLPITRLAITILLENLAENFENEIDDTFNVIAQAIDNCTGDLLTNRYNSINGDDLVTTLGYAYLKLAPVGVEKVFVGDNYRGRFEKMERRAAEDCEGKSDVVGQFWIEKNWNGENWSGLGIDDGDVMILRLCWNDVLKDSGPFLHPEDLEFVARLTGVFRKGRKIIDETSCIYRSKNERDWSSEHCTGRVIKVNRTIECTCTRSGHISLKYKGDLPPGQEEEEEEDEKPDTDGRKGQEEDDKKNTLDADSAQSQHSYYSFLPLIVISLVALF